MLNALLRNNSAIGQHTFCFRLIAKQSVLDQMRSPVVDVQTLHQISCDFVSRQIGKFVCEIQLLAINDGNDVTFLMAESEQSPRGFA